SARGCPPANATRAEHPMRLGTATPLALDSRAAPSRDTTWHDARSPAPLLGLRDHRAPRPDRDVESERLVLPSRGRLAPRIRPGDRSLLAGDARDPGQHLAHRRPWALLPRPPAP